MARAQATRQSLLRRAFSGHLVPQDPNDEPASEVLDRITVDRKAAINTTKTKLMPTPKQTIIRRPLLDILRAHNKPMTPEELFAASGYEHEFNTSKHAQEVVDAFYHELRLLTETPATVQQKISSANLVVLEAA
jgi:type I restriction enzyme S subunit